MNREIGSEFWVDGVPLKSKFKIPKWLEKFGNIVLTSSGRGALSLLLQQIKPDIKTVLLPAYICDSVITPFMEMGYECFFYDIDKGLKLDIESLLKYENIGIFVHMGYFGFQTNSNLEFVIKHFKKKSTIIVEDVTHTLFSNYQRYEENDFYLGSIRKWFGLPSGGFLASNQIELDEVHYENKHFVQIRKVALLLKEKYIETDEQGFKERFLSQFEIAEEILDNDVNPYRIDELSLNIINVLEDEVLVGKRRENYNFLLENLNKVDFLQILLPALDNDTCPLFFPILIKSERNQVRRKLIEEKIYCPVHWPIPLQINTSKYKKSKELYNSELSIPCDQRYDIEDMERIVSVIKSINK